MKTLLGMTGSVATILASKLENAFNSKGPLKVVVTESAKNFVDSSICPSHGLFDDAFEWKWGQAHKEVLHIELRRWASVLVIAPLSANTLAKMANGISDNLLTCVVRAWDMTRPIILAPAMNTYMWEHPITQKHIEQVKALYPNVKFVMPVEKTLACGDTGMGALAPIEDIVAAAVDSVRWTFPLSQANGIPKGHHPGAYGYMRKHDVHSGVDLYCQENQKVFAVEDGRVVLVEAFTGPSDGTPWWNDTQCVMIEGASGCVNYGEVISSVRLGQRVYRGQIIATVTPVLREGKERPDIPGHSRNMLHMELYKHGCRKTTDPWMNREIVPADLLDPTDYLINAIGAPTKILSMDKTTHDVSCGC